MTGILVVAGLGRISDKAIRVPQTTRQSPGIVDFDRGTGRRGCCGRPIAGRHALFLDPSLIRTLIARMTHQDLELQRWASSNAFS